MKGLEGQLLGASREKLRSIKRKTWNAGHTEQDPGPGEKTQGLRPGDGSLEPSTVTSPQTPPPASLCRPGTERQHPPSGHSPRLYLPHQPQPLDLELSLCWIVSGCGWQGYGSPINNTPRSQSLWLVVPQSWNLVRKQCHPAPCCSLWAAIKSTLTLLTLLPPFGQLSRIQSQHGTLQGQWETWDSDQMGRPTLPVHTFPCGSSQIPSAAHSWAGQPVWGRSTRVLDTDRGEQGPHHTFAPGDFPWVTSLPKSVFSTTGQEEHSHWRDVGKLNEIMQIKGWIE